MAHQRLILAFGIAAAAAPGPLFGQAPAGSPETRYCMRIEAVTGSRLEETKCWTRAEWAAHEVDVDRDWAKEGVRIIG